MSANISCPNCHWSLRDGAIPVTPINPPDRLVAIMDQGGDHGWVVQVCSKTAKDEVDDKGEDLGDLNDDIFQEIPAKPGLWVWEGCITIGEDEDTWEGSWRRPSQNELLRHAKTGLCFPPYEPVEEE